MAAEVAAAPGDKPRRVVKIIGSKREVDRMVRKLLASAAVVALGATSIVAVASTASADGSCFGKSATIWYPIPAGSFSAKVTGTEHDDVIIVVGAGNVNLTVLGQDGNDKICVNVPGGTGTIKGQNGNDKMYDINGSFKLNGGAGTNTAKGDHCAAVIRVQRDFCH